MKHANNKVIDLPLVKQTGRKYIYCFFNALEHWPFLKDCFLFFLLTTCTPACGSKTIVNWPHDGVLGAWNCSRFSLFCPRGNEGPSQRPSKLRLMTEKEKNSVDRTFKSPPPTCVPRPSFLQSVSETQSTLFFFFFAFIFTFHHTFLLLLKKNKQKKMLFYMRKNPAVAPGGVAGY